MLQSLGRPELHMSLDVTIVSGSGQEHAGCLLLTSEVLFVVSLSEDTQQQAFPITEVTHRHKESDDISQRTTRGPFIDNDVNVKPLAASRWSVSRNQDSRASSHSRYSSRQLLVMLR